MDYLVCVITILLTSCVGITICIYIDLLCLRQRIRNKAGIRYQYVSLREIFSPRCFWACCRHHKVVYLWLFALSVTWQVFLHFYNNIH